MVFTALDIINNHNQIGVVILLGLLISHFIGDFIFQNDDMALNKSTNYGKLYDHCFWYSITFIWLGFPFMLITLLTHALVDGITSRINKVLSTKESKHDFFCMVGFDQLTHYVLLLLTYLVLLKHGLLW